MLNEIEIKNLRSIKEQKISISPLTVLYGPNGSGKSTLLHSLAILKNFILNPNQPIDSFFNLIFSNFGGFEQVVYGHNVKKNIELSVVYSFDNNKVKYEIILGKNGGSIIFKSLKPVADEMRVDITFPYPLNQQKTFTIKKDADIINVTWNGIVAQVSSASQLPETVEYAKFIQVLLNRPIEKLKEMDFINLMRGFSKANYSAVSLSPVIYKEDEIATILANDNYLMDKVSYYLEAITGRSFRIHVPLGTATFWLRTTDKSTGMSTELVNDGFGINQVVYMLAKILRSDVSLLCIEEPEIHLHPRFLRNLAHQLLKIIKEENKTIIMATHSEHIIVSFLGAVATKEITPDFISCYLCNKEKKDSTFIKQNISENGQIEGGLATFMEGELEELKSILQSETGKH